MAHASRTANELTLAVVNEVVAGLLGFGFQSTYAKVRGPVAAAVGVAPGRGIGSGGGGGSVARAGGDSGALHTRGKL